MKIDWTKVEQPELVFSRFPSRRSVVYGSKGIVAASQPLAVEAGLEILRKGGNAGHILFTSFHWKVISLTIFPADAAVATSAALNVTEPSCCGIGGSVSNRMLCATSDTNLDPGMLSACSTMPRPIRSRHLTARDGPPPN